MVFTIAFDLLGPIIDWVFEHASAVAAGVALISFTTWFALWLSSYAARFKHVEADVAVLKQDIIVVNKSCWKE